MTKLYVVHYGDGEEPDFFAETGDGVGYRQALEAAERVIDELFDASTLQWGDNITKIYVAEVVAMVTETDRTDRPPPEALDPEGYDVATGIDWSDGQDYICDYGLAVLSEHSGSELDTSKTVH